MSGLCVAGLRVARGPFALGPLDFEVPEGTSTIVLGPTGAGKTTLLRALAGLLPIEAGTVTLGGERIEHAPPEARRIGFVPPSLGLLPHRRVRRNVGYALEIAGAAGAARETERWLRRFDLLRLAERYPHELSSGERQRVAMARALASRPRLLLWDEPLSALDVESREGLLELLRGEIEEGTLPLVLVTHEPATAVALGREFLVLDAGRTRYHGAPADLARRPLNRFMSRFFGEPNLYSREELESTPTGLGRILLEAAGPGGLALPPEALSWSGERPGATHPARVAAVRWTPAGWSVRLRHGPLTLTAPSVREIPNVRPGESVALAVDPSRFKPLEA